MLDERLCESMSNLKPFNGIRNPEAKTLEGRYPRCRFDGQGQSVWKKQACEKKHSIYLRGRFCAEEGLTAELFDSSGYNSTYG